MQAQKRHINHKTKHKEQHMESQTEKREDYEQHKKTPNGKHNTTTQMNTEKREMQHTIKHTKTAHEAQENN